MRKYIHFIYHAIEVLLFKIKSNIIRNCFKAKLYINCAKRSGTKSLLTALSKLRKIDASSKSGGFSGYGVVEMFITETLA